MFQLIYDKHIFQYKEDFEFVNQNLPDYVKAAIRFCSDWLSEKKTFIQQTSGSTGTPKKIKISRAQMIASAKATQKFFKTDENTKLLCCLDPSYIAGKMMLVRAMVWNSTIKLIEPKSNPLAGNSYAPDFVAMVPLQVEGSIQDNTSLVKLKAIKHLIIGGAPMNLSLKEQVIKNSVNAYQTYGMTETVSHVALAKIQAGNLVYSMLPMVEFGLDEREALWISSPMSGKAKIQTNDLIEILEERKFRWIGRSDFIINSGGIKVNPEDLAARTSTIIENLYPSSEYFYFGEKDEKLGEKVVLYIENSMSNVDKLENLMSRISSVLSKYEIPKVVYFLDKFDRTATSKIDKLKTSELK